MQRAQGNLDSLPQTDLMLLLKAIGNGAASRLMERRERSDKRAIQKWENKTGMPDPLKAGVEALSGLDLSDVRVHRHSSKPGALQALAYTQIPDIYIASGQERHLPHEVWHAVQQKQGRVMPTGSVAGTPLNDSRSLEAEADFMGRKALQKTSGNGHVRNWVETYSVAGVTHRDSIQRKPGDAGRIETFLGQHPGLDHLFKDIKDEMSEFDIVDTLLRNFVKRSDFTYTGSRDPIWSNQGDCWDLCSQFYVIARDCFEIELKPVSHEVPTEPLFVPGPTKQIGDKRAGNTDRGRAWIYDEHHWLKYAGNPLDVLFGHWGLGHFKGSRGIDENRCEYYLFGNKRYYFNAEAKNRSDIYTSNPMKKAANAGALPESVRE